MRMERRKIFVPLAQTSDLSITCDASARCAVIRIKLLAVPEEEAGAKFLRVGPPVALEVILAKLEALYLVLGELITVKVAVEAYSVLETDLIFGQTGTTE